MLKGRQGVCPPPAHCLPIACWGLSRGLWRLRCPWFEQLSNAWGRTRPRGEC